eukprot:NODE_11_length_54881_cov_1.430718.p47 type:complete len:102 gc:universal NODE_11_length_54881_cov_1.430718:22585-22890(+)
MHNTAIIKKLNPTSGLSCLSIFERFDGVGRVLSMIFVSDPQYKTKPITYSVFRNMLPRNNTCLKVRGILWGATEVPPIGDVGSIPADIVPENAYRFGLGSS